MNFEQARFNMIEQQIRTWQVLVRRTLDLFAEIFSLTHTSSLPWQTSISLYYMIKSR